MDRLRLTLCLLLLSCTLVLATAPRGPWDAFNFAPESRTVRPRSLKRVVGSVQGPKNLLTNNGVATLSGNQSYVTLDFGIEVSVIRLRHIASGGMLLIIVYR